MIGLSCSNTSPLPGRKPAPFCQSVLEVYRLGLQLLQSSVKFTYWQSGLTATPLVSILLQVMDSLMLFI